VLSRRINVLDVVFDGLQLAGFQVSITGRFWVSTEALTFGTIVFALLRRSALGDAP